ncbi:MAG: hypothetical protein KAS72_01265 [Phycisphaerales bacterium]|nr:hypothetical protein [Phycisphaerales bacterium]
MTKTCYRSGALLLGAMAVGLGIGGAGNVAWGQTTATAATPEQSSVGQTWVDRPSQKSPVVSFADGERPISPADVVDQPTKEAFARRAEASEMSRHVETTVAEHLTALMMRGQTDAEIDVQLSDLAMSVHRADAEQAEVLWSVGDIKGAIAAIDRLETAGTLAGVAINWRTPMESLLGDGRGTDVPIGEGITGATRTALDFDIETDNAYAAVAWGDMWTVERSPDLSATWFETSRFITTGTITDLDAAVVDEYLYVSYIDTGEGSYGDQMSRLRRCDVATGAQDWDYGTRVIGDSGSGNSMWEVSICTNADEQDDRVYIFLLDSTGVIHYKYASADGAIFYSGGTPVTNASGGLDGAFATFNVGYFLYVSYVDYVNDLHILRRSDVNVWEDQNVRDFSGYNKRTSISAWETNIICAFEEYITDEYGIRYVITYDSGDSWRWGTLADPETGESFYAMADVTARGGAGTAVVYQQDVSTHDELYVRMRHGYGPGDWKDPVHVNDWYTKQDTWTTINWLPPTSQGATPYAYGILYTTMIDNVWFDRLDGYVSSPGDNTDNPIEFNVPGDVPYTSVESTCDRVDDYDDTSMDSYDEGEDIIYQMTVTSASTVTISVTADTYWAGVGVFSSAPPGTTNCVAYAASGSTSDVIEDLYLDAGVYYIMVDTWPPPTCAGFTMTVTIESCPEDLDGDGNVGQSDLGTLLASYEINDGGDIDGDGDTDQSDLGMLLAMYGLPCP